MRASAPRRRGSTSRRHDLFGARGSAVHEVAQVDLGLDTRRGGAAIARSCPRTVHEDADQPWHEPSPALERGRGLQRREERRLHDVLRVVHVADEVERDPEQLRRYPVDEPCDGARVAVLAVTLEQRFVGDEVEHVRTVHGLAGARQDSGSSGASGAQRGQRCVGCGNPAMGEGSPPWTTGRWSNRPLALRQAAPTRTDRP